MKKILSYIALGAALASCIYPYTPDLEGETDQTLVVDGQILVGGTSTINLSYMMPLDGYPTGVALGTAWIEDEQGKRYGEQAASPSNRIQIDTEDAPVGHQYRAVIQSGGETYVSDWMDPNPAPTITNISFEANDYNVTVYVDLDAGLEGSGYIGFFYDETWEFHSDYYPEYAVNTENWTYINLLEAQYEYPYYWCFRNHVSPQIVLLDYTSFEGTTIRKFPLTTFARTSNRNHKRYSINVKAFALSKDAFMYNKQTQELSDIGGDLFSPDPGILQGNLVCESDPSREVMGMVLAGNVTSKRAFMYGTYYIHHEPYYEFVKVTQDKMPLYYNYMNFRPVKDVRTEEDGDFIGWAPHSCINCIEAGGYQEKPDFWED